MVIHLKRLIIILTCGLLLFGCSTKLTYNFLDWWIAWNVRSYVSLEQEQRRDLKHHIQRFHRWHRSRELPRYSMLLTEIKQRLQRGPIEEAEVRDYTHRVVDLWDESVARLLEPGTALLAGLSDAQVKQFVESLVRELDSYREDYLDLSPAKIRKQRIKRMTKILVPWIGRLNKQQRGFVREWANNLTPSRQLSFAERQRWHREFTRLLQERHRDDAQARVQRLFLHAEEDWSPEYRQTVVANQAHTFALLAQINNSLTEKQRQRRDRALQNYIDDFIALAELNNE